MNADELRRYLPRISEDTLRRNGLASTPAGSTTRGRRTLAAIVTDELTAPMPSPETIKAGLPHPKPVFAEPSETATQQQIIRWWRLKCGSYGFPEFALMGFPLSGARTKANGARLKAEGMRAGTPDLFLAIPTKSDHGLWLEMKTSIGRLSPAQVQFQGYLGRTYQHAVCRSFDEAVAAIESYLRP